MNERVRNACQGKIACLVNFKILLFIRKLEQLFHKVSGTL